MIHEIHRRSLWQVFGIFLVASWGVLQVVEVLTETMGLPDWTPTMAFVALLIGLPICLATAFVQEGMPGGQADATDTSEGAPVEPVDGQQNLAAGTGSLDLPSTRPSRSRRLFTWHNALLGGVGTFALLGFSLAAYFVMWTTGIGPVGNLVAQGAITEGERIILADFTDGSGEGYAAAITEALRIDLLEASIFKVVENAEINPVLRLMQVELGAALTPERAREVASRLGVAVVLEGDVTSLGTGYILNATLRATDGGRSLAAFRVTADGPDELIPSTDQLSQDIREKSGESLRTIRAGTPLEQVTTTSLEALRLYSEAIVAANEMGDGQRSVMLLERALLQDSTFAMAWRQLGISLQGGSDPTRRAEAIANAFRYRDRLRDVERFLVEALYYSLVAWDDLAAINAYENALLIDPDEPRALINLSIRYRESLDDWDRGNELLLRVVSSPSVPFVTYLNLIRNQIFLGRIQAARASLRDFQETYPNAAASWHSLISFAEGDLNAAADHARERFEDEGLPANQRGDAAALLADLAIWSGRLDESRQLRLSTDALNRQWNTYRGWWSRFATAYQEALLGDTKWARNHVREGLEDEFFEQPPGVGRSHFRAAVALAAAEDPEGVELVVQDWRESVREEWRGPSWTVYTERVLLYARVVRGDSANAPETLQQLLLDSGCSDACWLFDRAWLHDRIDNREQAVALYERVRRQGFILHDRRNNTSQKLHAMLRLGPLYEEMGDTAKAIDAYERIVDQWADGDARGQEVVQSFRERMAALGN